MGSLKGVPGLSSTGHGPARQAQSGPGGGGPGPKQGLGLPPNALSPSSTEPKGEVGWGQKRGRCCLAATEYGGAGGRAGQGRGDLGSEIRVDRPSPGGIVGLLFSRALFLRVLTFLPICLWFSEAEFTGFKSQSHFGHISCVILGKLLDFPEFVKWSLSHRIVGKIQSDDT